ncbi:MAG: DNA-processing protein DprA [Xanthomonadales bacterium]|nr:DNA-processing protein DprA [Xanthomonadales bacterium]
MDSTYAAPNDWLVLIRTPGFGAATIRGLLERHGSAAAALAAARRGEFGRGVGDVTAARAWLRAPDEAIIQRDLDWLAEPGHRLLGCDDADFPALLVESPGAPAALFVAGDPAYLWWPQVAIVGSRNASQAGLATARDFARTLASAGFAITSGLADGIDGATHAAALDAAATTIAVLGTGPDVIYPPRHRELAARIAQHGALVSEFPPGTGPHPSHFPRRNRIIAGLSLGTLVVEAGLRSGSLITARNAGEAGREVFAIPGSIHNPLARGCHRLIRQGAKLVETAAEVVEELAPLANELGDALRARLQAIPAASLASAAGPARSAHESEPGYARLLAALGQETLGIDQLAARSGLGVEALSPMLLMLELEGAVVASAGGYARRVDAGD